MLSSLLFSHSKGAVSYTLTLYKKNLLFVKRKVTHFQIPLDKPKGKKGWFCIPILGSTLRGLAMACHVFVLFVCRALRGRREHGHPQKVFLKL